MKEYAVAKEISNALRKALEKSLVGKTLDDNAVSEQLAKHHFKVLGLKAEDGKVFKDKEVVGTYAASIRKDEWSCSFKPIEGKS